MQSRTPQSVRARNGSLARSLCRALPRAVDVPPHLVLELPVGHVSVVVEVLRVAKVVCARALRVIVPDVGELDPAVALRSNPHLSRREPLVALQSTAEAMRHCGVAGAERKEAGERLFPLVFVELAVVALKNLFPTVFDFRPIPTNCPLLHLTTQVRMAARETVVVDLVLSTLVFGPESAATSPAAARVVGMACRGTMISSVLRVLLGRLRPWSKDATDAGDFAAASALGSGDAGDTRDAGETANPGAATAVSAVGPPASSSSASSAARPSACSTSAASPDLLFSSTPLASPSRRTSRRTPAWLGPCAGFCSTRMRPAPSRATWTTTYIAVFSRTLWRSTRAVAAPLPSNKPPRTPSQQQSMPPPPLSQTSE